MRLAVTSRARLAATAATTAAAAAALVYQQHREFEEITSDCAISEAHLPLSSEAQPTKVIRVPKLLSPSEVDAVHALAEELLPKVGSAGRTDANQAAAYRKGSWETCYLSTDGHFAQRMPWLRQRLVDACEEANRAHGWRMLERATTPVAPRCVEYHTVEPGGSLPYPHHHDAGSLVTIDVMLSDPHVDFEGGEFSTLEADGELQRHADFEKGDALIFVSHKFHCVGPVTSGRRHVLVMELWEGEERTCAHRCERHRGACGHTARMSFVRRALNDLASDL